MNGEPEGKKDHTKTIIMVGIVVILALFCAFSFYNLNGNSFDLSDRQVLLIVTDSMDGDVTEYDIASFPKNTFVMVKHLSNEEKLELQVGDVISFNYNGILDHHRIIETHFDQGYVITKGDNPDVHATENVKIGEINGKVIGTNHWLGALVAFVKDHFILVIGIIAAIAIIGEIYRAYKNGVFEKGS